MTALCRRIVSNNLPWWRAIHDFVLDVVCLILLKCFYSVLSNSGLRLWCTICCSQHLTSGDFIFGHSHGEFPLTFNYLTAGYMHSKTGFGALVLIIISQKMHVLILWALTMESILKCWLIVLLLKSLCRTIHQLWFNLSKHRLLLRVHLLTFFINNSLKISRELPWNHIRIRVNYCLICRIYNSNRGRRLRVLKQILIRLFLETLGVKIRSFFIFLYSIGCASS